MRTSISLLLIITLISCSKEEDDEISSTPESYIPMNIGDYWVYRHYYIDTTGAEEALNKIDSVVITEEQWHDGNKYFVLFEQTINGPSRKFYRRDSNGYLLDTAGRIRFAVSDFRDSLQIDYDIKADGDTFHFDVFRMETFPKVSVPAGEFNVLNYRGYHYYVLKPSKPNPRITNTLYARGIGQVLDSYFYFLDQGNYEKRL